MPNFNDLNRQGLIKWGGEDSTNYGIVVRESPVFDKPKRKQTVFSVPGRNGSILFQQDAFEDVVRTYKVWVAEDMQEDSGGVISGLLPERISAVTAWLNSKTGYQELEDSFEPDFFRLAYYSGDDSFSDDLLQYGEAELRFVCRPERFLKTGKTAVTVTNGATMTNPTKFASKPLIHIEGSGNVTVTFGGKSITADVFDYINIDCDTMNAYRLTTENRNDKITGSFPSLLSGDNTITISGTTTLVTITPRFFTI